MEELKVTILCPFCKREMIFLSRKGNISSAKKKCVFCGKNILVKDNVKMNYR